jgi:hypothetical protein
MRAVVTQALIRAGRSWAIFIELFGLLDRSAIPLGLANGIVVANFTRICRKPNRDQHKSRDSKCQSVFHLANSISFEKASRISTIRVTKASL